MGPSSPWTDDDDEEEEEEEEEEEALVLAPEERLALVGRGMRRFSSSTPSGDCKAPSKDLRLEPGGRRRRRPVGTIWSGCGEPPSR